MSRLLFFRLAASYRFRLVVVWLGLIATADLTRAQAADTLPAKPDSPLEKWVLEQLRGGEIADFNFAGRPTPKERSLRASFLQSLLLTGELFPRGIRISNATITGQVDLANAEVNNTVILTECSFTDSVNLPSAHFQRSLQLLTCTFAGDADFRAMMVDRSLSFDDSTFAGKEARFARIIVGHDFDADKIKCTHPECRVHFFQIKVGRSAFFADSEFAGEVTFRNADVALDFDLSEAKFAAQLELNQVHIGGTLRLHKTVWSRQPLGLLIQGLTYGRITALPQRSRSPGNAFQENDSSLHRLVEFIDQACYSHDAYANLEAYFRRNGLPEWGDHVYVNGQHRERERLPWYGKIGNVLLWLIIGYGRRPWLALVWSAVFVVVGACVFRGQLVEKEPQTPPRHKEPGLPFWYSLDVFVPAINLEARDSWTLKSDAGALRHLYLRLHTTLGWIIIPLGIVAILGLVKP